jgi:hypothetical protein
MPADDLVWRLQASLEQKISAICASPQQALCGLARICGACRQRLRHLRLAKNLRHLRLNRICAICGSQENPRHLRLTRNLRHLRLASANHLRPRAYLRRRRSSATRRPAG